MNTRTYGFISVALVLVVIFVGVNILNKSQDEDAQLATTEQQKSTSEKYVDMARGQIVTRFNPTKAAIFYQKALALDGSNKDALYELSRAQLTLGNPKQALALSKTYLDQYPNDTRMMYVGGLSAGYTKDFELAESLFTAYIKNPQSAWQSRLDLAWVQYQKGDYVRAEETLSGAIEKFGINAWLATSLGAVQIALKKNEEAKTTLVIAAEKASELTEAEWKSNYTFSDPALVSIKLAQLKAVIQYNRSLVDASVTPDLALLQTTPSFAGEAPQTGLGYVVSACGESCGPQTCTSPANSCGATAQQVINTCTDPVHGTLISGGTCPTIPAPPIPSNYGASCTVVNVCGTTATGTIACDGRCNAVAPLPAGFRQSCTITNRCGSASGLVGCNGACNVTRYPTCLNEDDSVTGGDDGWTTVVFDNGDNGGIGNDYGTIAAKITARPTLVRKDGRSVIRWNSYEMSSCTVTGTNGDSWTGTVGEKISRAIVGRVTYTLNCIGFDGRTMSDSVVVSISPTVQEI